MGGLMRFSSFLAMSVLFASAAFCQVPTSPAAPPAKANVPSAALPEKHASEILDMRLSADAATRALAKRYSLEDQIAKDLKGQNNDLQQRAVDTLQKTSFSELVDPAGDRIVSNEPTWCRRNLRPAVFQALLDLQQYDLLQKLAAKALSDGRYPVEIDRVQFELVKTLLAADKFDQALPAAKTYYNVCSLQQTSTATALLAEALLNGPGQKDPTIVKRFKDQQAAGAEAPSADGASTASADLGENILKSIPIDPTPYQAEPDKLAAGPKTFGTLTQRGNLLLLQDKGAEAVPLFQMTVDVTRDRKQIAEAVSNVARAMRARDGNVAAANAYILSLRQSAKPKG